MLKIATHWSSQSRLPSEVPKRVSNHLSTAVACCMAEHPPRYHQHSISIVPPWQLKNFRSNICATKLPILGMVIPPSIENPCNRHINPYYWVDDHPLLLYGNNGSFGPIAHICTTCPPGKKKTSPTNPLWKGSWMRSGKNCQTQPAIYADAELKISEHQNLLDSEKMKRSN